MKTVDMSQATGSLADYARDMAHETVIVTADGKPIAALVPIDNVDLETATLSENPEFLALIERSRARRRTEGGVSSDEMRRRLSENPKPRKP